MRSEQKTPFQPNNSPMSIRAIAQEVYRCQSQVHKLEDELNNAANHQEKEKIRDELRKAKAELKILKNMLEGRKEQSSKPSRKFPSPF